MVCLGASLSVASAGVAGSRLDSDEVGLTRATYASDNSLDSGRPGRRAGFEIQR